MVEWPRYSASAIVRDAMRKRDAGCPCGGVWIRLANGRNHLTMVFRRIRCKLNPVRYARSIGVEVGENVTFYGADPGMFSTGPWLIRIGNDVHIANGVRFLTHDGGTLTVRDEVDGFVLTGDIVIGENTYLGLESIVLPGVTIGRDCIIGARSVVTRDVPDGTVAAGVPARPIRTREQYIQKVKAVMRGEDSRYYSDLDLMHSLSPVHRPRRR